MTDVVGWGSKAGGQNRSNDDLMMGGRNFARGVFGDDTFLSPPLELQIGLGGFGQNDVTLHSL